VGKPNYSESTQHQLSLTELPHCCWYAWFSFLRSSYWLSRLTVF